MPAYNTVSHFQADNLISGDYPIVTESITLAAGQNLKRGAVLGRQTSGHYVLSSATATDGSEQPIAVLAEDVDATNSETVGVCYLSGQFNATALTIGDGLTSESIKHPLRLLNIYLTHL